MKREEAKLIGDSIYKKNIIALHKQYKDYRVELENLTAQRDVLELNVKKMKGVEKVETQEIINKIIKRINFIVNDIASVKANIARNQVDEFNLNDTIPDSDEMKFHLIYLRSIILDRLKKGEIVLNEKENIMMDSVRAVIGIEISSVKRRKITSKDETLKIVDEIGKRI